MNLDVGDPDHSLLAGKITNLKLNNKEVMFDNLIITQKLHSLPINSLKACKDTTGILSGVVKHAGLVTCSFEPKKMTPIVFEYK